MQCPRVAGEAGMRVVRRTILAAFLYCDMFSGATNWIPAQ